VPRHFLTGAELSAAELERLLDRAAVLKGAPLSSRALDRRSVALIFERPSTRTRLSFEAGIYELGGHPAVIRAEDLQLSRGESLRDTALVLSRHMAAVGLRTGSDATLEELARHATVPVFNMLSPLHHPCQALADLFTLREACGRLDRVRLAYVGDSTNVTRSLAVLGELLGVRLAVASPPGYTFADKATSDGTVADDPTQDQLARTAGLPGSDGWLSVHTDPLEAVAGAQAVYTDVWVSMGDEETAEGRRTALTAYRLDSALLDHAAPGAFALHCLPAHPGEEITAEVLYGPRQRIWEQAENRRHTQKALLELLLSDMPDG
jgi:ornithine carbamoyltransferase